MNVIRMAVTAAFMVGAIPVQAAENISIAQLPMVSESPEKGVFIDLVNAISEVSGVELIIGVYPFPRSIKTVAQGDAIAHLPLLDPENGLTPGPGLMFSTEHILDAQFSIFQSADSDITPENARDFRVETDAAHVGFFDFDVSGSNCLACSLKKINAGRLDALIFADEQTELVIAAEGLTGLKKVPYKTYKVKFVLREGDTETDQLLATAINTLKETGRLDEILAPVLVTNGQ